VSGQMKRHAKMARKVVDGKLTVTEARRRLGMPPLPARPPRPAVAKSAAPRPIPPGPAGRSPVVTSLAVPSSQMTPRQRALLDRAENLRDPVARELARQALVDEGVLPGQRQEMATKSAAGIVWAPGPDGRFGWRAVQPRPDGPAGLRIVPDGVAGR
jgi:hypothetical protein